VKPSWTINIYFLKNEDWRYGSSHRIHCVQTLVLPPPPKKNEGQEGKIVLSWWWVTVGRVHKET
jgi:hypothetical protein